jgi:hypothetical protein
MRQASHFEAGSDANGWMDGWMDGWLDGYGKRSGRRSRLSALTMRGSGEGSAATHNCFWSRGCPGPGPDSVWDVCTASARPKGEMADVRLVYHKDMDGRNGK